MSEGNGTAEWISRLFPQKQTGTQAPKKQTKGGKSNRSSSRRQRRQCGGENGVGENGVDEYQPFDPQAQNADPQAQNDDPQAQIKALQAQIDELHAQIDELQAQKEALQAQNVGNTEGPVPGGARKSKCSTRKAAPKKGGAGSGAVRTSEIIQHGGRDRVVYKGPRGGKYIKKGGEMVPISKL